MTGPEASGPCDYEGLTGFARPNWSPSSSGSGSFVGEIRGICQGRADDGDGYRCRWGWLCNLQSQNQTMVARLAAVD